MLREPLPRFEPLADDSDDELDLVERAQRDPRAFAPLYVRYFDQVYHYCLRRVGDRELAADATSQIFAQAQAALPRYRAGTFRGWLFTIARNVIIDAGRRSRPNVSLAVADHLADLAPTPEEHALASESRQRLDELLRQLPPDQRRVVELRLVGLTGPEIASALGKNLVAVKSTQFRAYARLRRLLGYGCDGSMPEADDAHE